MGVGQPPCSRSRIAPYYRSCAACAAGVRGDIRSLWVELFECSRSLARHVFMYVFDVGRPTVISSATCTLADPEAAVGVWWMLAA
jgi:hypothetical protein